MQTTFTDATGATINVIVNRNPLQNNYYAFIQSADEMWSWMGTGVKRNFALEDAIQNWNANLV
jgi:hypothetical protein